MLNKTRKKEKCWLGQKNMFRPGVPTLFFRNDSIVLDQVYLDIFGLQATFKMMKMIYLY